ncbi:MAG: transcription-repair coupling factor (superfamily II helicase) [Candidatus Krumholzibacteriia bacterium]|jgi:transcription-repair coupling factor (superfamily II helicase)
MTPEEMKPMATSSAGKRNEVSGGLLQAYILDNVAGEPLLASIKTVEESLQADPLATLLVSGLHGGATALMLSAWHSQAKRTGIVVTADRQSADQLADDLEAWLGAEAVVHLPQQEVLAFDHNSPEPALVGDFITGLDRLKTGGAQIVVTSISGLRQTVMAPGTLERATIRLKCDQRIEMDDLCLRLAARGYRPAGMVAKVGDFARRGGLLDVFTPGDEPLRIEFFDDEIVSVRRFDVETQRTTARGAEAVILPVSHLLIDDDALLNCLGKVEAAAEDPSQTVDPDFIHDLEARLEDRIADDGLEAYLPWLGPVASVADYLPAGAAIFWLDPVRLKEQSELLDGEIPRLREGRLEREPLLPAVEDLVIPASSLSLSRLQHAFVTGAWISGEDSGRWLDRDPDSQVTFSTTGQDLRGAEVGKLRENLLVREADGQMVMLLCDNQGQADRLAELLTDDEQKLPATHPIVGALSSGFVWPAANITCITDHEFFERYRRPTRVRHRSSGLVKERASLMPGEYVVHLEYGIGRYRGLKIITVEGAERECLQVEYGDDANVYVPVENIDQVERYSTDQGANPPLAKLGSGSWIKVKGKARKAIRAMAAELIELYAVRSSRPGYAFGPDTHLQRGLEESFLYDETPDQLTAIADVKRDMEDIQPMDRLVCGDVGFGKTEVAIRAAFKAVDGGKQVALLCPTTLLAQQHGATFGERFRDFPVRIETISRFRTAAEQKDILARSAAGQVDLLIGTHRLLSRDVKFSNLGLLIVDEEQRFGVKHKERLKALRKQVDVITLSATPIPRTLYLALMGARDMSLINTPPRDRLPIHTELCAFDKKVLVEAITRELHRGGQVFYVHNRVQTIEGTAQLIRDLMPNVRVAWAHGQMKEEKLEHIMTEFLDQRFDVLVSTTIIESGLDMPRVNTIIIDRADRFGLAQLYQLRGRVGRGNQRAFAYLMTPPGERLTSEARRRLAALEEFQALGSGYHIAMRDLEIRGAGNLLGEEQHGHMEAIGFDLYCRLLEETVAELQGGGGVAPLEVAVELRVSAYLPDDYVGDPQQKMDLYRRVARTRKVAACLRLRDEFRDRYGLLPPAVENLLKIQSLRIRAGALGIDEIKGTRLGLDFFFAGGHEPSPPIIQGLMATGPKGLQFKAVEHFIMKVPAPREEQLVVASVMLDRLAELCDKE